MLQVRASVFETPDPVASVSLRLLRPDALDARDHGGPALAAQILIYPSTDMRMGWPSLDRHAQQLPP